MPPKGKSGRGAKETEVEEKVQIEEKDVHTLSEDSDSSPKIYTDDTVHEADNFKKSTAAMQKKPETNPCSSYSSGNNEDVVTEHESVNPTTAGMDQPKVDAYQNPYPYPYLYPHPYPAQGPMYSQSAPQHPYYPPAPAYDPDQEYYMQYYSQQGALSTPTPGMSYEMRRSQNQMSHYFDTRKYPVNQPTPMVQGQAPKKVTKKDIERFKKRKEEKKKIKNKWLFE